MNLIVEIFGMEEQVIRDAHRFDINVPNVQGNYMMYLANAFTDGSANWIRLIMVSPLIFSQINQ